MAEVGSHTCPRALWYDVDRSGLETGPRGTFRPVSGPAVFRSSSDRVRPFMTTSVTYLAYEKGEPYLKLWVGVAKARNLGLPDPLSRSLVLVCALTVGVCVLTSPFTFNNVVGKYGKSRQVK